MGNNLKVSFCTTCMGRLHHLQQTLPQNMRDNPGDDVEFVVLDYGSRDGLEEWIKSDPEMAVAMESGRLVYARNDDAQDWQMAHAKNMAHRLGTGDILCNVDADNFTGPGFADHIRTLMQNNPQGTIVYPHTALQKDVPPESRGFFGRIALSRERFFQLGGYHEAYSAWGNEDLNLIVRANALGIEARVIEDMNYLCIIPHANEKRITNMSLENQKISMSNMGKAGSDRSRLQRVQEMFVRATGWAQCNDGHFGLGRVRVGMENEPVDLTPIDTKRNYRPAIIGMLPFELGERRRWHEGVKSRDGIAGHLERAAAAPQVS